MKKMLAQLKKSWAVIRASQLFISKFSLCVSVCCVEDPVGNLSCFINVKPIIASNISRHFDTGFRFLS